MPRVQLIARTAPKAVPQPWKSKHVFPSGSTLSDLMLGGGWGHGRVINIVGDRSAGKTLKAIEAIINFSRLFGTKKAKYNETEAAFDRDYAESIGMPKGINFTGDDAAKKEDQHGSRTVEEFCKDLEEFLDEHPSGPSMYVLDSLDALSDDAEMGRAIGEATYGTGKAKALSELFRRLIGKLETANCTLIIISQIRDKIGVTFGETKTRSGGRALDFYASQIVWLSEIGKIKRTITGVERVVGVHVRALNKKNKIGIPFRSVDLTMLFNFGIDDEISMLDWLTKNKLGSVELNMPLTQIKDEVLKARNRGDREALTVLSEELQRATKERWQEIENALMPPLRKYE